QAGLSASDVDTRSDIYSLGVLLYELLTGQTPFDPALLRRSGLAEFQRLIREVDPPWPSARIETSAARTLRGDLDWIVMKCIEKDRVRRYESASPLALDVRRYLAGEAVSAAPPDALYRVRKFVRRHRAAVIGVAGIMLTLLLGIVGTGIGMVRADRNARQ